MSTEDVDYQTKGWWRNSDGTWYPATDSDAMEGQTIYVERLNGTGAWIQLGEFSHTLEWRDSEGQLWVDYLYEYDRDAR